MTDGLDLLNQVALDIKTSDPRPHRIEVSRHTYDELKSAANLITRQPLEEPWEIDRLLGVQIVVKDSND